MDEKKDKRIAWMNINTACSQIVSARINAGLYKPKDNKEAIRELLDAIQIEYSDFLSLTPEEPKTTEENQPTEPTTGKDATEKMKRKIWGMIYGDKNGQPELEKIVQAHDKELNRFTITKKYIDFDWASNFIEQHEKPEY